MKNTKKAPKKQSRHPLYFKNEEAKKAVLKDAKRYGLSMNRYIAVVLSWRHLINERIDRGDIIIS
jgi:hypothetical protein